MNDKTLQEEAAPAATKLVDADVIDKGAEDIFNSVSPVDNTVIETEQKEEVIYEGFGKKFTTAEELSEYTKELENRVMASEIEKQKVAESLNKETMINNISEKQENSVVTDEMSDRIFEDPKGVLTELEQRIEQKFQKKENAKKDNKNFWETFYTENEDLKKNKRVVNLILKEKSAVISPMSLDKGKEFLAKEARAFMNEIGRDMGTKEKLTTGGSNTFGTNQLQAGRNGKKVEVATDFVSEMKSYQNKN